MYWELIDKLDDKVQLKVMYIYLDVIVNEFVGINDREEVCITLD